MVAASVVNAVSEALCLWLQQCCLRIDPGGRETSVQLMGRSLGSDILARGGHRNSLLGRLPSTRGCETFSLDLFALCAEFCV